MPYIPEHRFQGNLYTNGGEYSILSSGKEYQGFYYKVSTGKFFTGKTPYNNITQELIPFISIDTSNINNLNPPRTIGDIIEIDPIKFPYFGYKSLELTSTYINTFNINANQSFITPIPFSPLPTPEDYTNGTFIRYILYNTVTKNYIEVDQNTCNNISSQNPSWNYFPYIAFTLPWKISGTKEEILKTNSKMVYVISQENNLPSLSLYLVNLYEFSKLDSSNEPFTYTITYQNMEGEPSTQNTVNSSTTKPTNLSNNSHVMPDGSIMPGTTHEEYLKTLTSSINNQTLPSTPLSTPDSIPNNTNRGGY